MAVATSESNAEPFFLGRAQQRAAWDTVVQWVPVPRDEDAHKDVYLAAFLRWFKRKETQEAQTTQAATCFVRSSKRCRPRYMQMAMDFLQERLLHAPMDSLSVGLRQYLLELALQFIILREERGMPIAETEAVFSRIIPMIKRTQAEDFLLLHPDQKDAPEAALDTPEQVKDWWEYDCQSSFFFALYTLDIADVDGLRATFGNFVDVRALDHLRVMRSAMRGYNMHWRMDVSEPDGTPLTAAVYPLRFVGPFHLITAIEERPATLYPVSSDVWAGNTAIGRHVVLRMDDPYNLSVIRVFDRRAGDGAPAGAPARAPMEVEDDEDNDNN